MRVQPQHDDSAAWKRRFRAGSILWAVTARSNPARGLVCTNRDGAYQLYGWDVASGALHALTASPTGVAQGMLSADGEHVYFHVDMHGNEIGHYVRIPFHGGEPADITPDLLPYASFHIEQSTNGAVTGFMYASIDGFKIFTLADDDDAPQLLYASENLTLGPYLSADGEIAAVRTPGQSGTLDSRVMAFDRRSGDLLAELAGEAGSMTPGRFSPLAGDSRLLVMSSESGFNRPSIWDVKTSDRRALHLDALEGDVTAIDWSPDAGRLLLSQLHQAEYRLYVYDLESGRLTALDHPAGVISQAYFMPDGEIFAVWQDSTAPARLIALDDTSGVQTRTVLAAGDVPPGHKFRSVTFESSEGGALQAWLALPDGDGPFPVMLHVHGGPTAVMTELFSPVAQGWVDHGFAYFSVNYRGSTTFGRDFERAIWGRLGQCEVVDIADAARWLIAQGIAEPERIFMVGGSYGGYLTLLTAGRCPDLLAGGVAVAAIADWTLLYEDAAETLRGYFKALFGGTPEERADAYRAGSPLTYVDAVKTPLLIIQGRNDTRCPSRQMEVYADRLRELGKTFEIDWFDAGHGVLVQEQQVEQFARMLDFICARLNQQDS